MLLTMLYYNELKCIAVTVMPNVKKLLKYLSSNDWHGSKQNIKYLPTAAGQAFFPNFIS